MEGTGASDFVVAIGLVLALEGALYAAAPRFMKSLLEQARLIEESAFRTGGVVALAAGVLLVWLVRG
ncbi:MAG: DUF2065 domain-containing protein [Siculibacillus sp.]